MINLFFVVGWGFYVWTQDIKIRSTVHCSRKKTIPLWIIYGIVSAVYLYKTML